MQVIYFNILVNKSLRYESYFYKSRIYILILTTNKKNHILLVGYKYCEAQVNMNIPKEQVERFHHEIVELIKKYQFRDRNEMCCHGISVSQCYTLETLHRFGPLSMQILANKMHLSISTVTRVVKPLVKQQLISREEDPNDHRVRVMKLTKEGEEIFLKTWSNVFTSEKIILENFPQEQREILIELLQKLNKAFGNWKSCCIKK